MKHHFVNSPFVVQFTGLLWSFDLIIEVQVKLHSSIWRSFKKWKWPKNICCLLIFIYYKKKAIYLSLVVPWQITALPILFWKKHTDRVVLKRTFGGTSSTPVLSIWEISDIIDILLSKIWQGIFTKNTSLL